MQSELTLFPYQVIGRDFLSSRKYALLADSMGLGKSGQAIFACDAIDAKKILVICPASVRYNWDREFERFSNRELPSKLIMSGTDYPLPLGVTVCSYDLACSDDIVWKLAGIRWDVIIFDEIHFLKNKSAKRTQALLGKKGIIHNAVRVWLLSGTPAPNHPGEMWPWLYTLFPDLIDRMPYDKFMAEYCRTAPTPYGVKVLGGKNLDKLKSKLDNIMLRRRKEDVLKDLPPLICSDLVLDPADCNPGYLQELLAAEASPEAEILHGLMHESANGADVDLSEIKISTLRRLTGMAKIEAMAKQIEYDLTMGGVDKIVVFGIHRDPLRGLRDKLKKFGTHLIFGGTPPEKKQNKIVSFQTNHKSRVFVANIASAGTGIDGLQHAAAHVYMFESSWTPADNAQAIMRLHRIGQNRPVTAKFVSLANSLDEHIQRVIRRKTEMLSKLFE